MAIRFDFTHMMAAAVGEEHGIREAEIEALLPRAAEIHHELSRNRERGFLPVYDLPFNQQQIAEVKTLAAELAGRFDTVVVLGIGGSALGTTALFRALCPLYHNFQQADARTGRSRLLVLDNVDPCGFSEALAHLDPVSTVFLVISKSGSTVETMSQFLIAQEWLRRSLPEDYREHFVLITDPISGLLRRLADEEGYRSCAIPERVGGRFTVFTPVGLLPLAAAGVDIEELLAGAVEMSARVCSPDLWTNPAYLGAALQYLAYTRGKTVSVMMPYSDRLRDVADWYRQLWAESLGKKHALSGEVVHVGPTPVKALGATDQHSQVQLYVEGPFDKVVTFLQPENYGTDLTIPSFAAAPGLAYLEGHSLGELLQIEQKATALALAKNGRPNCTLFLPEVSPRWVGALIYLLEIQTLFAGGLFAINPLDQPGVEEGKEYTYGLMGRADFAAKKLEFERWYQEIDRRVL